MSHRDRRKVKCRLGTYHGGLMRFVVNGEGYFTAESEDSELDVRLFPPHKEGGSFWRVSYPHPMEPDKRTVKIFGGPEADKRATNFAATKVATGFRRS